MPSDPPSRQGASAWRWFTRAFEAIVVIAWLLLVLRDEYQVASLADASSRIHLLFLIGLAGAVVGRAVLRRGTRAVALTALKLGFAAFVTLVALVGAEYVLRFRFRNVVSGGNARQFVAQARTPPALRANSLGFREREIPPKTPGKYRIAVVGDSFAFGQGIEESERFSNLVEGFLGPSYEVFNFGRPGNNMPEHLDVLAQALASQPDFVLLQLYVNDFETPDMERPQYYPLLPRTIDAKMQAASILYDLVSDQWNTIQQRVGIADSYEAYMAKNLRDRRLPNAQQAYGNLRTFVDRAKAARVGVGIVFFPGIDAMAGRPHAYPYRYLDDGVRDLCADEKISCLDLLDAYSTFKDARTLWVSPFDAHPNAVANKRAAYEIVRVFGNEWKRR